jgi:hypothetical protein
MEQALIINILIAGRVIVGAMGIRFGAARFGLTPIVGYFALVLRALLKHPSPLSSSALP